MPVNIKVARGTIDYVMDDAEIALAFVDAANRPQVREGIPVIDFDDAGPEGFCREHQALRFLRQRVLAGPDEVGQYALHFRLDRPAERRAVVASPGQLWALSTRTSGALNEGERYIIAQPLFHMNGLFVTKTIFATNASVVPLPSFETRSYIEAIAKNTRQRRRPPSPPCGRG